MSARADGTDDVSTVELADGKKIKSGSEQSNPCSAANGMEEQVRGMRVWLDDRSHQFQDEWHTKDDIRIWVERERWNHTGVKNTISERWKGEQKSNKRAGSANIKQCPRRANGGTD